jgi:hypothetical protein
MREEKSMRWIPVDVSRITFLGTGKTAPVAEYVELSSGERRRSGNQAHDLNEDGSKGAPLYVVDVMVIDPDNPRAEIIGVKVASWDEPKTEIGKPVMFQNLRCMGYVQQGTNRVAYTFRADGIQGQAQQKAA